MELERGGGEWDKEGNRRRWRRGGEAEGRRRGDGMKV